MQLKKMEYCLSICLIYCVDKIEKKLGLIYCADKNHQIWRFWDQSFDMTFTGPSPPSVTWQNRFWVFTAFGSCQGVQKPERE